MDSYTAYSASPSSYAVNISSLITANEDYIIFTTSDYDTYVFYGKIDFTDNNAVGTGTLVHVQRTGQYYNSYTVTNSEDEDIAVNYSDATRYYVQSNGGYTNTNATVNAVRSTDKVSYFGMMAFAFTTVVALFNEAVRSRRKRNEELY